MQPNSPAPVAPPPVVPQPAGDPNQYDFIFNPNQQVKPGKNGLPGGGSKKSRMLIVGGAAVVLIIIASLVVSFLGSAGKADTENLVIAAKQQTELIRVADIGIKDAKTQAAKNIAVTTKLSLESKQSAMLAAIKSQGRKLSTKELSSGRSAKTDQLLTDAKQNNRFDEVFIETMESSLKTYQVSVKKAYDGATSKKLKDALTDQYKSANILAGVAADVN
jgi:flagellar basal body-associated protein FliL